MGINTVIIVRAPNGVPPLREDCHDYLRPIIRDASVPPGATHNVRTGDRWFGEYSTDKAHFWPQIREVLVTLMAACEAVWYGNDCGDDDDIELMTPERMAAIDANYDKLIKGDPTHG